jgi:MerR family redox-sensitive transcriptional activator SoxR
MTIGDVARQAGLNASSIRYYEKVGVLPPAVRVGGQRRYDHTVLERLAMLRFAKHVGFSVSEIRELFRGIDGRPPSDRWRRMAHERLSEVDRAIAQGQAMRRLIESTLSQQCPKLVERGLTLAEGA